MMESYSQPWEWPGHCRVAGAQAGVRSPRLQLQLCPLVGAIPALRASGSFSGKRAQHHERAWDEGPAGALETAGGQPGPPTVPFVRPVRAHEGPGPSRLATKHRSRWKRAQSAREGRSHQGPRGPEPGADCPTAGPRGNTAPRPVPPTCLFSWEAPASPPVLRQTLHVPRLLLRKQLRHALLQPARAGPPAERRPEALPRALPARCPRLSVTSLFPWACES